MSDLTPWLILAGVLLAAWLVRTPAQSGDPKLTRRLARSLLLPVVMAEAGAWLLINPGDPGSLKTDIAWVLLPPMVVLAILSRRRSG